MHGLIQLRCIVPSYFIAGVYRGHNKELEAAFGHPGPFWGRHYIFWHGGEPMTLIYEVFSPHLSKYLGPLTLPKAEEDDKQLAQE